MKSIKSPIILAGMSGALISVLAWGQDASQPPALPPGPLLARPESAQWQVTMSQEKTANVGSDSAVIKVKSVVVQGKIRHEESKDASGFQLTIWCEGKNEYYKTSSSDRFFICSPNLVSIYIDNSKQVFTELDWLRRENFVGIKNINGKPCLVFGEAFQALPAGKIGELLAPETVENNHFKKAELPRIAYIDMETRLPLYYQDGAGNYVYQFGPTPDAPLVLPDEIVTMLKRQEALTKQLSKQPARS